jgi:hypothetical protein
LHYYNFGARILESWDIDDIGKTKDICDMIKTYLLATRKDKEEKNSKEMTKRQLSAGELLLTMSVSRGSTTLRVILEKVRNNIKVNTDELIEGLDLLRSGIGDPKNPWKTAVQMLLEMSCREKKIMTNPRGKHLVKTLEMEKRRTLKMRWWIWSLDILEETPMTLATMMKTNMEMTTEVEQDAYLMGRCWST